MTLQGLPVGLRPHIVGIGSGESHLVYPSSETGKFILEDLDTGDTFTLDVGDAQPKKLVFGKHAVAILTESKVLFWKLETGAPLETWEGQVKDIWAEYSNWVLEGPNISFDPEIQDSKRVTIEKPAPLSYKYKPLWVGNHLHVGSHQFDIGPIDSVSVVEEYIIAVHDKKITVLFNLAQVGTVEIDEPALAVAAAVVDEELQAYCITPTKVAQFSLDIDFEDVQPASGEDSQKDILYNGWIQQVEQEGTSVPAPVPASVPASVPGSAEATPQGSSQDLLALLKGGTGAGAKTKLPPSKAPSTSSIPGPVPDSFSPPNRIPESTQTPQELLSLIKPVPKPSPKNKAHKSKGVEQGTITDEYVSRDVFDSALDLLKQEIEKLRGEVAELRGSRGARSSPSGAASSISAGSASKPKAAPSAAPSADSKKSSQPASVADAVQRTIQGERHLEYFEAHLDELKMHLNGASDEKNQMLKLVLIDAYHHTKLSKALVDSFGTPVVDQGFYDKIIGEECNA